MNERDLSDEFNLMAACCRWPGSTERNSTIQAFAEGQPDWDGFVALTKRHRVEGLVHRALGEAGVRLPAEPARVLAERAAAIATQNLVQAAASLRLKQAMTDADIPFLFLKGVTLACLAYGNLSVKQAWDIDLLVPQERALAAAAILAGVGYGRIHPARPLDDREFTDWMLHCKESVWTANQAPVVELHTALVDNPRLLVGVSIASDRREVPIGSGATLPTLTQNDLFAYLCVHGATHGWSRLKWLADVAAYAAQWPAEAVDEAYRHAERIGAGRSVAQALLLSSRLLGLALPRNLQQELERDARNRWLVSLALGAMARSGPVELDDTLFGTTGIHVSHFLLGRGVGFKVSQLGRKLINAEDRVALPLPRPLSFLYPILAMPLWVWRRYRLNRA